MTLHASDAGRFRVPLPKEKFGGTELVTRMPPCVFENEVGHVSEIACGVSPGVCRMRARCELIIKLLAQDEFRIMILDLLAICPNTVLPNDLWF